MTAGAPITAEEAVRFLYLEARLADEHQYEAWEALWTDDGVYWVPAADDRDPDRIVSIIYDNRSRIALRVRQLLTGTRWAQAPPSSVRRLISNVELLGTAGADTLVGANFLAVESRDTGTALWAGRSEYHLRRADGAIRRGADGAIPRGADGAIRMARKKVLLVDRAQPLRNLGFLI